MASFRYKIHAFHQTQPDRSIIAANTRTIWSRTQANEKPIPRADGWWGPHEYSILPQPLDRTSPYLAWIPTLEAYTDPSYSCSLKIDYTIMLMDFNKFPLVPVTPDALSTSSATDTAHATIPGLPSKPNANQPTKSTLHHLYRIPDLMCNLLKLKVRALLLFVRTIALSIKRDPDFRLIRIPEQAMFHLEQAYLWLRLENTMAGHRLALAGLRRAILELHGFILWYKDEPTNVENRDWNLLKKSYPSRGVYVDCLVDYNLIGRFGVPVLFEVDLTQVSIPESAQQVPFTPIPMDRNPMFPQGYASGQHTFLYFYPPEVKDHAVYELASRGYCSRIDNYKPNRDINKIFENLRKDKEVAEGIYFPFIMGPTNPLIQRAQEEFKGLQSFAPLPPLREWNWARHQIIYPPLDISKSRPPKIRAPVPPTHFFFNAATPQKQMSFFFIWFRVREQMEGRWNDGDADQRDKLLMTHDGWRSILSGEVFKKHALSIHDKFQLANFLQWDNKVIYPDTDAPPPSADLIPRTRAFPRFPSDWL
jgi:hypothetical protein